MTDSGRSTEGRGNKQFSCSAHTVLFDMDGTLIDSTPAVNATWRETCNRFALDYDEVVSRELSVAAFTAPASSRAVLPNTWRHTCLPHPSSALSQLKTCHGWRTIENLARFVPTISAADLPKEVAIFEGRISEIAQECLDGKRQDGRIDAMPGAKELLREVSAYVASLVRSPADVRSLRASCRSVQPVCLRSNPHAWISARPTHDAARRNGWAIVTSATAAYAHVGFASSQVSVPPDVFITGDICVRGKPDPYPYVLGAEKASAPPTQCIVVEDAPAGVRSGKASGAKVLGLCTTHSERSMWEAGADWVVQDLRDVRARWTGEGPDAVLTLNISSKSPPDGIAGAGTLTA